MERLEKEKTEEKSKEGRKEEGKGKKRKRKEKSLNKLENLQRRSNIQLIRAPEGKNTESGQRENHPRSNSRKFPRMDGHESPNRRTPTTT